jgi:hypothetical protein
VADDRAVSLIFVLVAPKRRTVVVVVVVVVLRATVDVDVAVPLGNLSPGPRGEREKPDEEYHETSGTSSRYRGGRRRRRSESFSVVAGERGETKTHFVLWKVALSALEERFYKGGFKP